MDSLGRTTCLTGTDTAGTNFNAAAAKAVIDPVNGTTASVNAALASITAGTLAGGNPGATQIAAVIAAATAVTDLQKATFITNPTFDGIADANNSTLGALNAKNAALVGAVANDKTVVQAGLTADADTAGIITGLGTDVDASITSAATLYAFYTKATTLAADRAEIDTAFAAVSVYSNFKAVATTDVTKNSAQKASDDAEDAVEAVGAAGNTVFTDAVKAAALASKTYTDAQAADANKVAVDAIDAGRDAAVKAVADAGTALSDYNATHTTTKTVALASVAASDTVKEAFYFSAKATDANDFTIGTGAVATSHFGAGDAIVLGTGYSFNSGALSTGDNNKLEFFFVKTDAGTQVVIETANYGSAAATPSATTGVAAANGDNLAVITLTGVTADHLSVNNGVVSYV